jgi:hypothetical protein
MSTHLDAAQARADQATSDRTAAELVLRNAMVVADPSFNSPVAQAIWHRKWEARFEDLRNVALVTAYSAFRRAQRAETKARSALHRLRFEPILPSAQARQRQRRASRLRQAVQAFAVAA